MAVLLRGAARPVSPPPFALEKRSGSLFAVISAGFLSSLEHFAWFKLQLKTSASPLGTL